MNKDADQRIGAIYVLGTFGVQNDAVPSIEARLQDKDSLVRVAAAKTLGEMQAYQSIPKLYELLDDKSTAVSFAAAQALWRMGDERGRGILTQVLTGERGVSSGLIHSERHDMQDKVVHDPTSVAEFGVTTAAGSVFPGAGLGVAAVKELARDKTAGARAISARSLGSGIGAGNRVILEKALNDKSWVVRAAAAEALGHAGDESDIDKLMPLMRNSHPALKYNAAAAIVRLTT